MLPHNGRVSAMAVEKRDPLAPGDRQQESGSGWRAHRRGSSLLRLMALCAPALLSAAAKESTAGAILACTLFASARVLLEADELSIKYTISGTSS